MYSVLTPDFPSLAHTPEARAELRTNFSEITMRGESDAWKDWARLQLVKLDGGRSHGARWPRLQRRMCDGHRPAGKGWIMKNIASRVTNLEQRVGRVRHVRTNAGADADFARLMADEAGRDAAIALNDYMRTQHPDASTHNAAVASDAHATRLYDAFLVAAHGANAGRARRVGVDSSTSRSWCVSRCPLSTSANSREFGAGAEYDSAMRTAFAMLAVCVVGCGCVPATQVAPSASRDDAPRLAAISSQEREVIEAKVREHLKLPSSDALGPAEFARVTELDLKRTAVSNAGAAWLADPATGLSALATLNLQHTALTDAGLAALARADTGLKSLTALYLAHTKVTDAGVHTLARVGTGLSALTQLDLRSTAVTDAGVTALARADTGLKGLTSLDLSFAKVTDAGIKLLADKNTGLKGLTVLGLASTQIADAGLAHLAHKDTGLTNLRTLNLAFSQVTDAGVKAAARADSGLAPLHAIFFHGTRVTDIGVADLAHTDTGLKSLKTLDLGATAVTDEGVRALARADSGLTSLTSLHLRETKVTDAGVAAVKARWATIEIAR